MFEGFNLGEEFIETYEDNAGDYHTSHEDWYRFDKARYTFALYINDVQVGYFCNAILCYQWIDDGHEDLFVRDSSEGIVYLLPMDKQFTGEVEVKEIESNVYKHYEVRIVMEECEENE